ncbi:hypothetical protein, partial [Haloarcula marismortui]|uniref:hypothetical protein n=1 Tax=Haloarcula marismortui TaxID=2238 RepID=UPI0019D3B130
IFGPITNFKILFVKVFRVASHRRGVLVLPGDEAQPARQPQVEAHSMRRFLRSTEMMCVCVFVFISTFSKTRSTVNWLVNRF